MTDRGSRLAAARRLDWRFLLPDPRIGRVGVADPADSELTAALQMLGHEVRVAPASQLAARGGQDVVMLAHGDRAPLPAEVADAVRAAAPGGWILVEGPKHARASRTIERSLHDAGAERVDRLWSLPSRREARRIVPLDDSRALRAALSMHGSRPSRRLQGAVARHVARMGGAELLGGEVTLLARRRGGPPASIWPTIGQLEPMLSREGLSRPSWLLLTPRFPASAHVVFLLLADGAAALVAKVARLPEDDGPEREAEILHALSRAGLGGSVPDPIHAGRIAGHAVLVERALHGRPLDRRRTRDDPGHWIGAVAAWTARMPVAGRLTADAFDELLRIPIQRLGDRLDDVGSTRLVEVTLHALAPLRAAEPPLVFEHGDLGHPNLLQLADGRIGVLDWEVARPDGLPLNDLLFFLGYVALATGGDSADPFGSFERVLSEHRWSASETIKAQMQRLGLPLEVTPSLIVACWARATASLADRLGTGRSAADPEAVRAHRYYSLWSRAVEHQGKLAALLS